MPLSHLEHLLLSVDSKQHLHSCIGWELKLISKCRLSRVLDASSINLSLMNYIDVAELEELIGYKFKHKGLLLQAFVHPFPFPSVLSHG
jgi:hypothetical protein